MMLMRSVHLLTSMFDVEVIITPFLEPWVVTFVMFITSCLQGLVKIYYILEDTFCNNIS